MGDFECSQKESLTFHGFGSFGKRMPKVALLKKGNSLWVNLAYEPEMIWKWDLQSQG